ncbi:hypothetical protein MP638_006254 [Amoeboaphelidium occidentale]|nr:hypothetical protein MP638_006254 [Amoeboaphelidium occidentale]
MEHSQIVEFHKSLPFANNSLRLFLSNDEEYFVCVKEDAEKVAKLVYKTMAALKQTKDNVPYLTITKLAFKSLIDSLSAKAFTRIEIYKSGSGSNRKYSLDKVGTPGNLFQLMSFCPESSISSVLMFCTLYCASEKIVRIESIYVDLCLGRIGCCLLEQREDDEEHSVQVDALFESLLLQFNVKEITYEVKSNDDSYLIEKKIRAIVNNCDIAEYSALKSGTKKASSSSVLTDFLAFSDVNDDSLDEMDKKSLETFNETLKAFASDDIVNKLVTEVLASTLDKNSDFKLRPEVYDIRDFMSLDSSAVFALDLFPRGANAPQTSSLFGILNKCRTKQGSRLLECWIRQPSLNYDELLKRQSMVEMFVENPQFMYEIQKNVFKSMGDVSYVLKRLLNAGKSKRNLLKDITLLYDYFINLKKLEECMEVFLSNHPGYENSLQTHFKILKECNQNLEKFGELVETTIDLDAIKNHEYLMKPEFDDELLSLRDQMDSYQKAVRPLVNEIANSLNLDLDKKLKFDTNAVHGFHLRVSRNDAGIPKKLGKDYIELSTQKSGVLFTTKDLKEISSGYDGAKKAYDDKQRELVTEIVDITKSYQRVFEKADCVVEIIDVLTSLAHVAATLNYCKPELFELGTGELNLKDSRHPCLELQDGIEFIKNDAFFSRNDARFQIITGANMGGKSTFIRQIGMILVMAQIGSYVPCSSAKIPLVDSILARVGAGDKPLKGISTFMAEMMDTATILKSATRNSFVLIDELGRGTSTFDGFGLAWSIADSLVKKGCYGVFATHFHELTYLADQHPEGSVKNFHVKAVVTKDEPDSMNVDSQEDNNPSESIVLLYKVEEGRSDQSFGLCVAQMAKFPTEVVELARRKVGELNEDLKLEENPQLDEAMVQFAELDAMDKWLEDPYNNEFDDEIVSKLEELSAQLSEALAR